MTNVLPPNPKSIPACGCASDGGVLDAGYLFVQLAEVLLRAAKSNYVGNLTRAAEILIDSLASGKKLLVFGNGGSAADAEHIAAELIVRFKARRRALPAIALTSGSAIMTACANDFCYEDVFARQIEALGSPGDVAMGISTSGRSPNVLKAIACARLRGLRTILLTGPQELGEAVSCELILQAPGASTATIQEVHLASYHAICGLVDERFSREEA